jgi:anaerobic dimethyl sulfoxide reductase subunit A
VVDIPQGAWYEPDEQGVDRGGCINVLTAHRWTPFAYGTTQHTIMVEVERYKSKVERQTTNLRPSTFDFRRNFK